MLVTVAVGKNEISALRHMKSVLPALSKQEAVDSGVADVMDRLINRIMQETAEGIVRNSYRASADGTDCLTQKEIRFVRAMYQEYAQIAGTERFEDEEAGKMPAEEIRGT